MPKTNHLRNFTDERDYSVPEGDWACGKHGAANNRRGMKKGVNRVNRTRLNRVVKKLMADDETAVMPRQFKEVKAAHDHKGKSKYVTYG